MIFDDVAGQTVLFGGDPTLNDTWVLDVLTKTWTRAIAPGAAGSPPAVLGVSGAMVYDPDHDPCSMGSTAPPRACRYSAPCTPRLPQSCRPYSFASSSAS